MRWVKYNQGAYYLDIHKWTDFTEVYREGKFCSPISMQMFASWFKSTNYGKTFINDWLLEMINIECQIQGACKSVTLSRTFWCSSKIYEIFSVYGLQLLKNKHFINYGYKLRTWTFKKPSKTNNFSENWPDRFWKWMHFQFLLHETTNKTQNLRKKWCRCTTKL